MEHCKDCTGTNIPVPANIPNNVVNKYISVVRMIGAATLCPQGDGSAPLKPLSCRSSQWLLSLMAEVVIAPLVASAFGLVFRLAFDKIIAVRELFQRPHPKSIKFFDK